MESFINEDARLAVKKGIVWLDENHPDWVSKIDLTTLRMSNCDDCIIGQVIDNYKKVLRKAATQENYWVAVTWAVEHGFESPCIASYQGDSTYYGYSDLETLWSEEVRSRLG